MKTITVKFLESKNVCNSGIDLFKSHYGDKEVDLETIVNDAIKLNKIKYLCYCSWLITKCFESEEK